MADEENVDQEIEIAEEKMEAEGSPAIPDDAPAAEAEATPAEEPQAEVEPEAEATPAEEPEAEASQTEDRQAEAQPETSPEEEPASEPSSEAASDDSVVERPEVLAPKERRRRARQLREAPTRPARTPEGRQAERDALRAKNAKARTERRRKVRAKKPAASPAAPVAVSMAVAGTQKSRQGIVVSDKAAKTITVRIDTSRRHRRYQKIVRSSKTLHAHDEHDEAHEGDLVRLVETRPLSATKRWRLVEILERAR